MARRLQEGSGSQGHLPIHHCRGVAVSGPRPADYQHRSRTTLLRPELPGNFRQDAGGRAVAQRRRANEEASGDLCARGKRLRCAGLRHHRVLGAGKRLRRRPGQGSRKQITRHPGLRLPTLGDVPRPSFRCAAIDRTRRPARRRDNRLLGGRARTDADDAVVVDGKRNLIKSAADVIGSSGKYLVHLGWKRGEPWLQEVRVPANLPWKEADLSVQHPRSTWLAWGVTRADGKPLPNDAMRASVVLPLGRLGPAFLAYDNFQAYLKWNQSLNYSLTAAYYATRLDGAPPMHKGSPDIPKISFDETRELQQLLEKRGYDVGRIDGVLGLKSRVAIRDTQIKFGLPADGWPTAELLARLRAGR